MPTKTLVDRLIQLAQLDIDAILVYNQAIAGIVEPDIRHALLSFRADHERHVAELGEAITELGGTPPEFARDLKGVILEGVTAIAGEVGTRSALAAMLGNETLTNARYKAALAFAAPTDITQLIRRNYLDEQRHLGYVKDTLREQFGVLEILSEELRAGTPTDAQHA